MEKGTYSVAVGDFDEDGHQDLAVATTRYDDVTVLLNNRKENDVEVDYPVTKIPRGEGLSGRRDDHQPNRFDDRFRDHDMAEACGGEAFVLKGPRTVSLGGGIEKVSDESVRVLDDLPLGDYILAFEATSRSGEVLDEDSFRVRVVGSGGEVAVSAG